VEWVASDDGIWIVQARPIVHRVPPSRSPGADALAFSAADPDVVWRWDVAHNPDPLTPAQAALVDRVAPIAVDRLRVVEGYLYVAPSARPPFPSDEGAASTAELVAAWQRADAEVNALLSPLEASSAPDLDAALTAYEGVYASYARFSALLSRARRAVDGRRDRPLVGASIAPDVRHAGSMSRAWDVGAPTFAELGVAWAARSVLDVASRGDLRSMVAALAEADDVLFYRAQAIVRRALLALAETWALADRGDVFYLPWADGRPDRAMVAPRAARAADAAGDAAGDRRRARCARRGNQRRGGRVARSRRRRFSARAGRARR
jgi:hypothetical protein